MAESKPRALCERLCTESVVVSSATEFIDAHRDAKTISFLDSTTLAELDELSRQLVADDTGWPKSRKLATSVSIGPVILISSESPQTAVAGFQPRPWLSHVVSPTMLEHSMGQQHLDHVIRAATTKGAPRLMDWIGAEVSGRRVRIAHASRRVERLEKMARFLESQGASQRVREQLHDAAEEILVNAFYNAPVAAGAVEESIPRNHDVSLPDESAIDVAYGCRDQFAFVRVRDPFGSLSWERLVESLSRAARTDKVEGSGLGLSHVFSLASVVAVSVLNNQHTEVLVCILDDVPAAPRPFAFHLFFKDSAKRRSWKSANQDTLSDPMFNSSVSIVLDPK